MSDQKSADATKARDWRPTVFLPKTSFPMKAGLARKEPEILERWQKEDLYQQLREQRKGAERFILHDGPPYANGDIHIGHALNKILKDIVMRSQTLLGKDVPYVPGWDCHGLPIEWKVEEQFRKKKLNVDKDVNAVEFRQECRKYAVHWVDTQRQEFKRLGVLGEWDNPYLTMNFEAEAIIAGELMRFSETGQIYRGAKPVLWSVIEKTALAEAEVDYADVDSTTIDLAFKITDSKIPELVGGYAVIWTTTPWTIPVNRALAYGPDIDYVLADLNGKHYLFAEALLEESLKRIGHEGDAPILWRGKGAELDGSVAQHPMFEKGGFFAEPRPFLGGTHVTTEAGTGIVHMAPDYGEDDFLLCKAHQIDPVFAVEDDGRYRKDWLWMGGEGLVISPKINAADGPICSDLREVGALLATSVLHHSYPHSWRSKAKLIYRCTPQWFIALDRQVKEGAIAGKTLRETALEAIDEVNWFPAKGKNRIQTMVEGRPDWVISRQRAWGVPITLYVNRESGDYLRDPEVNARILEAFRKEGADAWFKADHQTFLGDKYRLEDYEPVNDILDVWFDSGSTHAFVVEARYGEGTRAQLYLEGSDQHRGWFQSSLLESCGSRGHAPYDAVMTHGFTLDGNGRKMSKSVGNVIDPLKVINESGADILRMWVASTDYTEDVRIGKEVLSGTSDGYRKLRNSFRYLLGALEGFSEDEKVAIADLPELEKYVLHLLAELDKGLHEAVDAFAFNRYLRLLSDFVNNDLSAFFFDIRKDRLYCDIGPAEPKGTQERRAYRTVLDILFHALVRYAAPILCFTAEEVWLHRFPDAQSVHLSVWPEVDSQWKNGALGEKWAVIREQRQIVTEKIEPLRREKIVGSSLEAEVTLPVDAATAEILSSVNFSELCITAKIKLVDAADAAITVDRTENHKCGRCWQHLPEVEEDGALCSRCQAVVGE
ncbi:isoleucyl-tRNA synthetase [Zymomonas mobilis]|uniref:Isoleucine--tRNA ligase n=1 Tax=Zymomonas mobilis TaxID=542 RepID=A0A542VZS7_ZYMMB|nr:isoleucine--tRNA ligase [Zymomonas mobilis]TQL16829.1 isoleucyl-tRNA synthetase [Zymomonas mobilis]